MEKSLKIDRIQERLGERGLNPASLAKQLGLSRAAISKWLTGKAFPRPAELLKLGKLLDLGFKEIVGTGTATPAPLVAFRKRAGTITTEAHTDKAQEMGRLLEALVPHLGHDRFVTPGRLKNPVLDYDYIQELVAKVRLDLGLDPVKPIDFGNLIARFNQLQAVLVPVMWGRKSGHANALHLYLPDSQTTWVLLNLDSELHDFKFWMAHELGHVLSVGLLERGDIQQAEDFADAFAGALLFPRAAAAKWLLSYQRAHTPPAKVTELLKAAREYVISPWSVYKELEKLATATAAPFDVLAQSYFHGAIATFNKDFKTISEILFDGRKPSADHFMLKATEVFQTPVFKALREHVSNSDVSESVISRMLDIPLIDAKELRKALV
jgi:transcriptional regulator with XRE-family HTH domain/Zn-dependent peptidase ImmA (M78 family)